MSAGYAALLVAMAILGYIVGILFRIWRGK